MTAALLLWAATAALALVNAHAVAHTLRVRNPAAASYIQLCEIDLFLPDGTPVPLTFSSMSNANAPNPGTNALDDNTATCALSLQGTEPQWVASYTTAETEVKGTVRLYNVNTGTALFRERMNGAEVFLDGEVIGTLVYDAGNALEEYNFSKIPTAAPTRSPGYFSTRAPTTATPTFAPLEPPQFFAEDSFVALGVGAGVAVSALLGVLWLRRRSGSGAYGTSRMGGMGSGPSAEARVDMERGGPVAKPIMAVPKSKAELAAEKQARKQNARGPPPAVRAAMDARNQEPERPPAPPVQHGNIAAPRTRGFLKNTNLGL